MKYFALFVLSSLTVGLVLAFPGNRNIGGDLSPDGHHAAAVSDNGSGDAFETSETTQIRQPRHFLKKLFSPEPHVVVQPILIQPPQSHSPYDSGRGYGGYGGYGGFSNSYGNFGYNRQHISY